MYKGRCGSAVFGSNTCCVSVCFLISALQHIRLSPFEDAGLTEQTEHICGMNSGRLCGIKALELQNYS